MSNTERIPGLGHAANPSSSGGGTSIPSAAAMSAGGGIAMVICGFVVLGMGLVYVRWVFRWFSVLVSHNEPPDERPHLESKSLAELPTFAYRGGATVLSAAAAAAVECSICLGVMSDGEVMRKLPVCGHVFHRDCIDVWLRSRSTCPICRDDLLKPEEGDSSTAASSPLPPPLPPPLAMQFGLIPL